MDLTFPIIPKRLLKITMLVSVGLAMLSLSVKLLCFFSHDLSPGMRCLRWLVDVDREDNLPSAYSTLLLSACGLLLGGLAWIKRQYRDRFTWQWFLLSALFWVLAWDEAVSLHETIVVINREHNYFAALGIPNSGIFHFSWVVVGLGLIVGLAIAYFPLLRHLPKQQQRLFLLSAGVYLSGALGMEMVGGIVADWGGEESIPYILATHIEELLEMWGMNLFGYSLLQYIARYTQHLQFNFLPMPVPLHPEMLHTLPDVMPAEPMRVEAKH